MPFLGSLFCHESRLLGSACGLSGGLEGVLVWKIWEGGRGGEGEEEGRGRRRGGEREGKREGEEGQRRERRGEEGEERRPTW